MTRFQRLASTASILATVLMGYGATAMAMPDQAAAAEHAGHEHGHRGHHGRGDLVRAALHLDSLTPAQRQQIEALVQQEKANGAHVRTARGQLMEAVARGVDAGNVDPNAVKPQMQALESAIANAEPGKRASLEKLHAILTPAQRTELVSRIGHHFAGGPKAGDGGAPHPELKARLGRPLAGLGHLNLTDAQKQQIEANMKSGGAAPDRSLWKSEMETHKRVIEAFGADRFVMNELAPPEDPRVIDAEVGRMVSFAKAAAPVLTPEQRVAASAKLRAMAQHEEK
jgi:Spy/CpxP family protein refolding chaperone